MRVRFDRSFLPDALFEFVVISDTHYMRRPEIYASGGDSQDARITRQWPGRAAHALETAGALEALFVVHLGDLAQEYPGTDDFEHSRRDALSQIAQAGLNPYYAAGNMDIGDKPNDTVPADWVTAESLAEWHTQFGRSWYSFDKHGVHFAVVNSQIMRGPLQAATEQELWLEADLATNHGRRVFLFLHIPPFFVDEGEAGFGHYNSLDEPVRHWLLELIRKHGVEMVFSGHTHFAALNRVGTTRLWVVPSTTTSRSGFYEVFSASPPDAGRNDVAKLGFYLVRVNDHGAAIHLIRTNGETGPAGIGDGWRYLLTRTSNDLSGSPVGVYLRLPIASLVDGVVAWPDVVRQRVRNDYPLLACLELGVRHLRVPIGDMNDALQKERLRVARDEGMHITGVWVGPHPLEALPAVREHASDLDAVEMQMAATLKPESEHLQAAAGVQRLGLPVTIAPLLATERMPGKFHPRTRIGYRAAEIAVVDAYLRERGAGVDRLLCRVDDTESPWGSIETFLDVLPLRQVRHLDFLCAVSGDPIAQANRVAEVVFAAARVPGCRIFLDPLTELDRTSDTSPGLLDRLSNPGHAFHTVRCLNTLLFSHAAEHVALPVQRLGDWRVLGLRSQSRELRLLLPDSHTPASNAAFSFDGVPSNGRQVTCVDLQRGVSRMVPATDERLRAIMAGVARPMLMIVDTERRQAAAR